MAQEFPEHNPDHPQLPSSKEGPHDTVDPQYFPYFPPPVSAVLDDLPFRRKTKSHARKQNPGHVPRPRNAFILFRCNFVKQRVPDDVVSDHRDISRLAGCMWRTMSDEQKRPWFEKAEIEKQYHLQMHPTYRFAPERGSQPKRLYQRKKPPVSEEILLLDPRSVVESRAVSPPGRSSAQRSSPHTLNVRLRPNPQEATAVLKHRHIDEELRHSKGFNEINGSRFVLTHEEPPPSSPGQYHGGFVQLPPGQEGLPNLEGLPVDSNSNDHGAYWLTGTSGTHDPDPYSVSYSPIPTSALTPSHGDGSLYGMWQDLDLFHERPLHSPNPDLILSQGPYDDFSNYTASPSQEGSYTASPTPSVDEVYDASGYLIDAVTDYVHPPVHSP